MAIPSSVLWSYVAAGTVLAVGLTNIFRGPWQRTQGLEKLLLFGPVFFGAPVAAFGTEHFTLSEAIASIIPAWMPLPLFWVYLLGGCFIVAGLSLATGLWARLSSALLAFTFFLFVALMHGPAWLSDPSDRFALAIVLRELSFSAGALALFASLAGNAVAATIARIVIGVAVLFFSYEQFLHGDYVPGIPLNRVTPDYVFGHAIWTYLAAAIYAVCGVLLLAGKKARLAALAVGVFALFLVFVVYVPTAIADRASIVGLNFWADTLMFSGAVLLLARAMPSR